MSDFTKTPLQNQFSTQIVGELSGGTTAPFTLNVKKAIDFTPAAGGFRAIIEPGTSREEGIIVTSVSDTAWTVGTRGEPTYKGGSSSATTHGGGSKIIITDTWSTFEDMATAINSKLDQTGDTVSAFDLKVTGTDFRIREDSGDMKLTDDSQAEVSLATLAAAAGVDDKAKVSNADTTSGYLEDKVTAGDGLTGTITSPAGNEAWDLDVDLTDTAVFRDARDSNEQIGVTTKAADGKVDETFLQTTDANIATLTDGSNADSLHTHTIDDAANAFNVDRVILHDNFQNQVGNNGTFTNKGGGIVCSTDATGAGEYAYTSIDFSGISSDVSGGNPRHFSRAFLNDTSNQDGVIGFTSGATAQSNHNNTVTADHVSFLIADAAIVASVADGTTQEKSADLGGTYPVTTMHSYYIEPSGANFKFYIDGVLVHTSTANNPDGAIILSNVGVVASSAQSETMTIYQHTISFDE